MPEIIVCLKIIIDPEMPASLFRIDGDGKKPVAPAGTPPVISPFDLNALEAALRIKNGQESKVTVLSLGKSLPKALLQKALAMGADEAVAIEDAALEHIDPFATARTLANAIHKIGSFDLVFTGRQAADWDAGIVWAGLAELLNLPCITIARKATLANGKIIVERSVSDGIEILESQLPALITFSSEVGEPRFASLQAMLKAAKKPVIKWKPDDVGFSHADIMSCSDLREPELQAVDCRYVQGGSDEEKGRRLARILLDQHLIATRPGGEA